MEHNLLTPKQNVIALVTALGLWGVGLTNVLFPKVLSYVFIGASLIVLAVVTFLAVTEANVKLIEEVKGIKLFQRK